MRGIEAHYNKNVYGIQGEEATGRLQIEVTNIPEFYELLQRAEKEAHQLNETISRLKSFELNIDFSIANSTLEL